MKTIEKRKGYVDNYKDGTLVQTVIDQENRKPWMLVDGPTLKTMGATWENYLNLPDTFKALVPVEVQGGKEQFPVVGITGVEMLAARGAERGHGDRSFRFSDWMVPKMMERFSPKKS